MHGLNEKFILKRMMDGRLPDSVLKRPKQAYRAPMSGSFFSSPAREYTNYLLSEHDLMNRLFSYRNVQQLIHKVFAANWLQRRTIWHCRELFHCTYLSPVYIKGSISDQQLNS